MIAVGEAIGMRWILLNEAHEVPPEVFNEMVNIIARMLGGHAVGESSNAGVGSKVAERAD